MTPTIRRATRLTAALALAALAAAPAALQAQSGQEVLETALDRHAERMEGVQNYTVVAETMGFESTTYFERVERDGDVFFVPREHLGSEAAQRAPDNPWAGLRDLADRATLEGTETVDGEECYAVVVTDLEGTELYGSAAGGEGFRPERATFLVDTDDYLLRGMRMEGTAQMEGETRDVTFDARMLDYREVDGVVHPFRTEVSMEGMGGGMSEEERRQARQSMQEMQQRMEKMPEQQREMMERMMGDRMEQMEQMVASGAMDFTVKVKEIRVNEGPPEDRGGR